MQTETDFALDHVSDECFIESLKTHIMERQMKLLGFRKSQGSIVLHTIRVA